MLKQSSGFLILALLLAPGLRAEEKTPKPNSTDDAFKLLVKPDFYKTLVNPQCSHCIDEAKRRAKDLRDDDRILAWTRGKYDGGAVPLRFFLAPYRVISDSYGVWVYDADAGFMRGYEPSYDFTFYGWRNGVMAIKHKDGTVFSALSGVAFDGPRKGDRLKPLATIPSDWGYWVKAYPHTVAYNMFEKYQPVELPQEETAESLSTRRKADSRLPDDTQVLGIFVDGRTKAYPLFAAEKSSTVITDKFADQEIVVLEHYPTRAAAAYIPEVEGSSPLQKVTLTLDDGRPEAPFIDTQTHSHWGVEGRAVDGPLMGKTLRWLDSVQCKWFAWAGEYPNTEIQQHGNIRAADDAPAGQTRGESGVIVDAAAVTPDQVKAWKHAGITAVVAVLDEEHKREACDTAAKAASEGSLKLFYWIEVARNPAMASEHPRWMAALGMHDDWEKRFPNSPHPGKGEVAKAFPWVPITSREAYEAHLARVKSLLTERAAEPYAGVLLNDLQGGPASCGCGNLQCRWATDYHVASTATKQDGDDAASRFMADVRNFTVGKLVVPVWTTECEDIDLPANLAPAGRSTKLCGSVACANTTCPKVFTKQWASLLKDYDGPVGVLALEKELERDSAHGQVTTWIPRAVDYLDTVPPKNGGASLAHERIWLVIQGYGLSPDELTAAGKAAAQCGTGSILKALVTLPQSYEPRVIAE